MKGLMRLVVIWVAVLLAAGALLFCWQVYLPKGGATSEVYVVQPGFGVSRVAADLQQQGIIKSALFFKADVWLRNDRGRIQAGSYRVSAFMSADQIIWAMVSGDFLKTKVTVPEGWTMKQIAQALQEKGVCSTDDFLAAASRDWSGQFDFLSDKPKDASLEGYLFPDTYEIPVGYSAKQVVQMMLENFGRKFTADLRQQATAQGKSVFDEVIMASILEKEVQTLHDKQIVAGILWKRISAGIPLQVDATVNYATGKQDASVSAKDAAINSPYNTYLHKGLPVGPIANPGTDSLEAAVHPVASDYWYYLSAPDGTTVYSKTAQEHEANVKKYLTGTSK